MGRSSLCASNRRTHDVILSQAYVLIGQGQDQAFSELRRCLIDAGREDDAVLLRSSVTLPIQGLACDPSCFSPDAPGDPSCFFRELANSSRRLRSVQAHASGTLYTGNALCNDWVTDANPDVCVHPERVLHMTALPFQRRTYIDARHDFCSLSMQDLQHGIWLRIMCAVPQDFLCCVPGGA